MPAGRSNASSLLKKVNSQLRGERVPIKTKEEDELATYLQALSQKTQQAQSIDYEEHGDISISSGADAVQAPRQGKQPNPSNATNIEGSGSKFLKKKKAEVTVDVSDEEEIKAGSEIVIEGKKRAITVSTNKAPTINQSRTSALDKASALANKIKSRGAGGFPLRRTRSGGSESDDSIRGSDVGKRPGSGDTSIGRDANRFLKSRKTVVDTDTELRNTRSPSPQLHPQRSLSLEKKESPKKNKNKGEIVRTLGNVYLTSEEESLAEFIHGLSTSETSKKPQNLVAKKQQKWRKKTPSPAGRQNTSPIQVSRSPSPFKNRSSSPFGRLSHSMSQDSDMLDSMASEINDQYKQDNSISSDDNFGVNLMDISNLLPATKSPDLGKNRKNKKSRPSSAGKKISTTSTSVFKASVPNVFKADRLTESIDMGKKREKNKKASKSSSSNLFESFGIQMADDLLDIEGGEAVASSKGNKKEESMSDDSEILTEKSQDMQNKLQRADSESEIKTEIASKPRKAALERQMSVEDSISERLNERSSFANNKQAHSSSEEDNIQTEADYSDSFLSETDTLAETKSNGSLPHSKTRNKKPRHESFSKSSKRKEHKIVVEEKRVDISSTDVQGRTHFWNAAQSGFSVSGPSLGLQYVDPTPIATHVVSADALEAMTAYSPNMLALQDMMRSQLQLISSFMDIQKRIYQSCMDGLHEDYQYTTLEDTKKFIQEQRKPRMTMDEALRLVDLEDGVFT